MGRDAKHLRVLLRDEPLVAKEINFECRSMFLFQVVSVEDVCMPLYVTVSLMFPPS